MTGECDDWVCAASRSPRSSCLQRCGGDHYGGVAHGEPAARWLDHISDPDEQLRKLLRGIRLWPPKVGTCSSHSSTGIRPFPVELPLLQLAEPPGLPNAVDCLIEDEGVGRCAAG